IPVEGMTKLVIFDLSGREVATLVNETLMPGYYTYDFNASTLASGVYFYRLVSKDNIQTKRMVLIK
ncbi:MAG: T9SS type A sorting domain-containing protein, partial [Ignavibacteriales bacterium]|nr:T9SS type A sorting domain-containing protein [Ignavibacteriales bacterium]